MIQIAKKIFQLLNRRQRRSLYTLQLLIIAMAMLELMSIAAIGPFMALVADLSLVAEGGQLHSLYVLSRFTSPADFLFFMGVVVLCMLGLSTVVGIITTWRLSFFAFTVGMELGNQLYRYYLNREWLFHAGTTSAQLRSKIGSEIARVTGGILLPILQLNGRVFVAFVIGLSLFIWNPFIAIVGLSLFGGGYFFIYRVVKERLRRYDVQFTHANAESSKLLTEGFGGIKDILMLDRSAAFIEQYENTGILQSRAQGLTMAISMVPRYFMEFLAFGAMVGLVLFLIRFEGGNLVAVLPQIAIYGLAGFKMLPALQQIYANYIIFKGNVNAFDSVRDDLYAACYRADVSAKEPRSVPLHIAKSIVLDSVRFRYPSQAVPALDGVSITIPLPSVVGIVGATGSGKSTLIDILLGLIEPNEGQLMVDGVVINESTVKSWQSQIRFVPQSIFLTEGSIAENVAFGLRTDEIDEAKVRRALKLAHLSDFVDTLPDGINTKVGERGVRLSGGQRQRIGIARALYDDSTILVFDEATSALDGITEKIIMKAIDELAGERTIVLIAHRLKTVMNSNIIYMLDDGKVIDSGTYNELIEKNAKFREMAKHA